jgi:hypothetical protein
MKSWQAMFVNQRKNSRAFYLLLYLLLFEMQVVYSQTPVKDLDIFNAGYPRCFIFWTNTYPMSTNSSISATQLDATFMMLNGVCSPSTSWAKFNDFKKKHPEQFCYLFTAGSTASEFISEYDPYIRKNFYDGHWVYFAGTKITADLIGETTIIPVQNTGAFFTGEDVALCKLDENGKPDWNYVEHVKCNSINSANSTITVTRGMYGSTKKVFTGNSAWAAAHAQFDWGSGTGGKSWTINHSTTCPKNAQGKTIDDLLIEQFSALFLPGGTLENYDGLEFDLSYNLPSAVVVNDRGFDTNGDGIADNGIFNGKNEFGIGLNNFHERLRTALGDSILILGDGNQEKHQRSYGILNGFESEWWPKYGDGALRHWSNGINYTNFWKQNSRKPSLNYFNHKIGGENREDGLAIPYNLHRLVFAAAQFTDAVLTTHRTALPVQEPGNIYTIWDEFVKGKEKEKNWLGMPQAPAVRLALNKPDLLNGIGKFITSGFLNKFTGTGASFAIDKGAIKVTSTDGKPLKFTINAIPCSGIDLFLSFKMKGEMMAGYPVNYARYVLLNPTSGDIDPEFYVNQEWFNNCVSLRKVSGSSVNLVFEIDGSEPVWISDFTVHAHPDAIYRNFENGVVIANPSDHNYEFNLTEIRPGTELSRIMGSSLQDPMTNNGAIVGEKVTLGNRDALFLRKTGVVGANYLKKGTNSIPALYPNPTSDKVYLYEDIKNELTSFNLFTTSGVLMKTGNKTDADKGIYLGNLSSGVYLMEMEVGNKRQIRNKVFVE